jgi:hypothetical protein
VCNFLSGVVTTERHPKVLCGDLLRHEVTVQLYKLKPETYREWEWPLDDAGRESQRPEVGYLGKVRQSS